MWTTTYIHHTELPFYFYSISSAGKSLQYQYNAHLCHISHSHVHRTLCAAAHSDTWKTTKHTTTHLVNPIHSFYLRKHQLRMNQWRKEWKEKVEERREKKKKKRRFAWSKRCFNSFDFFFCGYLSTLRRVVFFCLRCIKFDLHGQFHWNPLYRILESRPQHINGDLFTYSVDNWCHI